MIKKKEHVKGIMFDDGNLTIILVFEIFKLFHIKYYRDNLFKNYVIFKTLIYLFRRL